MIRTGILAFGSILSILSSGTWAQCPGCPDHTRVNNDYQIPPSGGSYRLINNRREYIDGLGKTQIEYNFKVADSAGKYHVIPMADPTILAVKDGTETWYYVTGTSEATRTANFAIYKSKNLYDWSKHSLAFSESGGERKRFPSQPPTMVPAWGPVNKSNANYYASSPISSDLMLRGPFSSVPGGGTYGITLDSRLFTDLWAPQLYMDSEDCNYIYLSFTARETRPAVCCPPPPPGTPCESPEAVYPRPTTTYVARILVSSFLAGGAFGDPSTGAGQPWLYGYTQGSGAIVDGGFTRGIATPCSADLKQIDPCSPTSPGAGYRLVVTNTDEEATVEWVGSTYGLEGRTVMSLDSFVFFDPLNNNKRWMFYTWRSEQNTWQGNHVAAYQMFSYRHMGTALGASIMPMAYRYNHSHLIPVVTPGACSSPGVADDFLANGVSRWDATPLRGCQSQHVAAKFSAAEGPAAFHRSGRTYLMWSRNNFFSPAYGMYYRLGTKSIGNLGMGMSSDPAVVELALVQSLNRNQPYGRSFGHGEMFTGPRAFSDGDGRTYLIYHAKEDHDRDGDGLAPFDHDGNEVHDDLDVDNDGITDSIDPNIPLEFKSPIGYTGRTVFFKDLRFANGGIITVVKNDATGSVTDTDAFLVPWAASFDPTLPCPGSQQLAGGSEFGSPEAFLSQWFVQDESADVDQNGSVDQLDLFTFVQQMFDR